MYDGPRINAPTGRWKDELCDCFTEGICHPSLWCSCCCSCIAMGQIMSRMQLTWLGGPGPLEQTRQTFFVIVLLTLAYWLFEISFNVLEFYEANDVIAAPTYILLPMEIVSYIFIVWYVVALCRTRKTVRERYQIPENSCTGCEDCCCAFWCQCCVTAQMLRHTGEYEHYPGVCCSATGHPPRTPLVV
jgi:Cys-rich protein (TIGR01571 family)